MFDDFDIQRQSDEIFGEEADLKAQDRWYHETFEDVIWSDFLEQMTYAND